MRSTTVRSMQRCVLALLVCVAFAAALPALAMPPLPRVIVPHTVQSHAEWHLQSTPPAPSTRATLSLVLSQRNTDELQALLLRVSDPSHADYGRYPSRDALRQMVAPDQQTVAQIDEWAQGVVSQQGEDSGAEESGSVEWNAARDIVHVHLPVRRMERLLGHEVRSYQHADGKTCLRVGLRSKQLLGRAPMPASDGLLSATGNAAALEAIPVHLRAKVAYVAGVTRFPLQVEAYSNARARSSPDLRTARFRAPASTPTAGASMLSASTLSASGEDASVSQVLSNVILTTGDESVNVIFILACAIPSGGGVWTLPKRVNSGFVCMQGTASYAYTGTRASFMSTEANSTVYTIDIPASRYPMGMTTDGRAAIQVRLPLPSNYHSYTMAVEFLWGAMSIPRFVYPYPLKGTTRIYPLTVRQLYGVPDALLDGVSGATRAANRMSIGALALEDPSSQGFFRRTDIASFLAANRIDPRGAQGVGYVDGSIPPVALNERNPDVETTLDVEVAMGANPSTPLQVLHIDLAGRTATPIEDLLDLALADRSINVLSLSYGIREDLLEDSIDTSNFRFQMLGAAGVSVFAASGDSGAFITEEAGGHGCAAVAPSYPGSSPWVTSVGGSTLSRDNGPGADSCPHEVVCSVEYGASITSGGGFSGVPSQQRPDYQSAAVEGWLAGTCTKPSTLVFNTSGRAYPDVTLLAHSYEVHYGGGITLVDGTSASAPVLAGIVAAYNNVRAQAGRPALGFLNPLLYQSAQADPRAFNDITEGNSKCMRAGEGCCADGFHACTGFDPASGLGSPNFRFLGPRMLPADVFVPSNVSNHFFPSCGAYTQWPAGPRWPSDSDGGRSSRTLGIVIGLTLLGVAIGALAIFFAVRHCHKSRAVASNMARMPGQGIRLGGVGGGGAGGGGNGGGGRVGGNGGGGVASGVPVAGPNQWGPGRVLGHAAPLSPNDLAAPLDPAHGQV